MEAAGHEMTLGDYLLSLIAYQLETEGERERILLSCLSHYYLVSVKAAESISQLTYTYFPYSTGNFWNLLYFPNPITESTQNKCSPHICA